MTRTSAINLLLVVVLLLNLFVLGTSRIRARDPGRRRCRASLLGVIPLLLDGHARLERRRLIASPRSCSRAS